ncbi:MAG: P-II family nitrogen regulator [Proteobacteria bacterium]|nr:P-II family nitrogen regulator [Pseudomonadota bacterium]
MAYKCILAMLKPDLTEDVVDDAKKAGATGATIIAASGTGAHEAKTFFGLTLDVRTDVVIFLLAEAMIDGVLKAVEKAGRFDQPGTGIAFVLPVERTAGLESQMIRGKQD